jgi:hypothetical protein
LRDRADAVPGEFARQTPVHAFVEEDSHVRQRPASASWLLRGRR